MACETLQQDLDICVLQGVERTRSQTSMHMHFGENVPKKRKRLSLSKTNLHVHALHACHLRHSAFLRVCDQAHRKFRLRTPRLFIQRMLPSMDTKKGPLAEKRLVENDDIYLKIAS
jgi:hypothetical protein